MKRLLFVIGLLIAISASSIRAQSVEAAKKLIAEGKAAEAAKLLQDFISKNPKEGLAWTTLAEAQLQMKNYAEAEAAAQRAIEVDDEIMDAYAFLGQAQMNLKKYDEAQKSIERGVQRGDKLKPKPNRFTLYYTLGTILMSIDSVDPAAKAFHQALLDSPNSVKTYIALGDAYLRLNVIPYAIQQYEKAISLDSTNVQLLYHLSHIYYKEKRYNEAAEKLLRVVNLDTKNERALFELAKLYYDAKLWKESAKYFQLYVQRFPKDTTGWRFAMETSYTIQDYENAFKFAVQVTKHAPKDADVWRKAAWSALRTKKIKEGISHLLSLQKLVDLTSEEYRLVGSNYQIEKKDSLAAEMFDRSLALDSSNTNTYLSLAILRMSMRNYDKAIVAFQERLRRQPPANYTAYFNYALCLMQTERWEEAKASLYVALQLNPTYVPCYLNIARCLNKQDSIEVSTGPYQTFLAFADTMKNKNKNDMAEASRVIGLNYLLNKKYEKAIEYLKMSLKHVDNNFQTHLMLAQAYHGADKQDEAIREYRLVLKMNPGNKDAAKGLQLLGAD